MFENLCFLHEAVNIILFKQKNMYKYKCSNSGSILILFISMKKIIRINMWMNPAKEMDQFRKTEKFIEHECCKWKKQIKVFKALKVNSKFTQGRAKHLVYVLVVLILFIISSVCINSYHGCTKTVYLNRVFLTEEKKTLHKRRGHEWHQQGHVCGILLVISAMDVYCEW